MKATLKAFAATALIALASGAAAQIPGTGIGPAPTDIVPGEVVPVPAPNRSPTYEMTPGPLPTPALVNPAPAFFGQRTDGTPRMNTFNEQQVRSNLMARGYTSISNLTVDSTGAWHGSAVYNGASLPVTVDSNGLIGP